MKKKGELQELRGKEAGELVQRVSELEEELMRLRFRKAAGQLEHSARLGTLRRQIARAKTVITQKSVGA